MSGRPLNVLFVTLDQWRADCLSASGGSPVRTPCIDDLIEAGAVFANHYSVAAPCGPARASLLTGLYLHNHRSVRNGVPLDARHRTVAQSAARLGYEPMLFGFTDTTLDPRGRSPDDPALITSSAMAPGFSDGLYMTGDSLPWLQWLGGQGYATPSNPRDIWRPARARDAVDDQPTVYSAEQSESAFLTRAVTDFIARSGQTPWFAHVSYFRPHHPYIAPEPYNKMYRPADAPAPVRAATPQEEGDIHPWLAARLARQQAGPAPVQDNLPMSGLDEGAVSRLRAAYHGSVSECDVMIGRLVGALKAADVWDHTLIILTSDHGDMLGDRWLWGAETWHEQAFKVPLVIRDPRESADVTRGVRVTAFTESVDVAPTLMAIIGGNHDGDGRDLSPFLTGLSPADWRTAAHWELDFRDTSGPALEAALGLTSETSALTALRTMEHLYVAFAGLPSLLFDASGDILLTDTAIHARLAEELLQWRMRTDERPIPRGR